MANKSPSWGWKNYCFCHPAVSRAVIADIFMTMMVGIVVDDPGWRLYTLKIDMLFPDR